MAQVLSFRFSSNGGDAADADAQTATVQDDGDVVVNPAVIPAADYALVQQLSDEVPDVDDDGVVAKTVSMGTTDVLVHRDAGGSLLGFSLEGLSQSVDNAWSRAKLEDFGSGAA